MSQAPANAPGEAPPGRGARALVWGYRLFPVLLLPLMLVLSRDFGVTWDEKTHQLYGERVYRFLTAGQDDDWFRPGGDQLKIYLHGGFFDTVCVAAQKLLTDNIYVTRHYVGAAFGWLGIVYVGRLGRLLAGPGTGLLAMVMLALSPRYFGDSMNNPKDVPLAALLAAALYYMMRLSPRHPFVGWRAALGLVITIGLAVSVRAGALLYLGYLAVALVGLTLAARDFNPRRLAATFASGVAVVVAVLLTGTLFWPWAQVIPLKRPIQGMLRLSEFRWDFPVLFDGRDVPASALPWSYIPQWALIVTPPVVMIGVALAVALLLIRRAPGSAATPHASPGRWRVLALLGAAFFPGTYIVLSGATIYDGIRHLTFAYPPFVVLAACGWLELLRQPSPSSGSSPPRFSRSGSWSRSCSSSGTTRTSPCTSTPSPAVPGAPSAATSSTTGATACSRASSGWPEWLEPRTPRSSSRVGRITSFATTCSSTPGSRSPGRRKRPTSSR